MAIPDYQSGLLQICSSPSEPILKEGLSAARQHLSALGFSEIELIRKCVNRLPNRMILAISGELEQWEHYCLIEPTRRGYFRITPRGLGIIKQNPPKIDIKFLDQFEEFKEFRALRHEKSVVSEGASAKEEENPEELLESAYENLRKTLASDLLQQIKQIPPSLFEKIVVDLVIKMGYGGSRKDAGQAVGKSGDEGIDGIIKEDRLGLDTIYIQAKKWENPVGRPEVQKFAGALQGQRAKKGIFITTSNFTKEAHDYASRIDSKIVLIDGDSLAEFMIGYNIGVTPISMYEVKKVDLDYFTEE